MNTILFNNSLGVEKRQTLLCLLICSNAVIFRAEPSVGTGNIFLLDQHFLILGHGSITAVLKCSLVESFAAELILVRLSIIATIGLATETQHFCAPELLLEKTRFSLVVFLVLFAARAWEKVTTGIRYKIVIAVLTTKKLPHLLLVFFNAIIQTCLSEGEIERISIHFHFLVLVILTKLVKEIVI